MILLLKQHKLRKQFESLRPQLYRIAWSWCHNADLAEDLVQETYLRALEKAAQLKEVEKLKPWLMRIMSNLHTDCLRRRQEFVDLQDLELEAESAEPCEHTEQQNAIHRVRCAVAKLNEDQRQVLTLVDIGGFTYAEVAEALELPIGTVMSRLCRARKRLKGLLQKQVQERPKLRRVK